MLRTHAPARRPSAAAILVTLSALAALALALAACLGGCERAPDPPAWNNPFDPSGPDGGDPLQLRATAGNGLISLTWTQPQGMGIAQYAISRAVHPDSAFTSLALVDQTTALDNVYLWTDPAPTRSHWFRVQALDADGNASLASYAQLAGLTLGPRVILNHGAATLASRFVTAKVVVSRGTTLRVALGPAYTSETTYPAAAAGDTAFLALDAGTAAQGDTVRVRVIATDGTWNSAPTIARARVDFSPDFTLAGGGTAVASRTVTLSVPPEGVTQMRFAPSEAELAGAAWLPGAATRTAQLLSASTGTQEIWGEFTGDFGLSSLSHLTVTPDLLTTAAFHLALPEDHLTDTVAVRAVLTGKASLVRWSETPDLAAAPWQAHRDTLDLELSPAAGLKTIYLQLRNDWADSPVLTDYAVLVSRGVEVAFTAPQAAATLRSGVPLQVRGTAFGATAGLDSVQVDLGDGNWRRATGTTSWSRLWDVPIVLAETDVTLRARAWAEGETATAVIVVKVAP